MDSDGLNEETSGGKRKSYMGKTPPHPHGTSHHMLTLWVMVQVVINTCQGSYIAARQLKSFHQFATNYTVTKWDYLMINCTCRY